MEPCNIRAARPNASSHAQGLEGKQISSFRSECNGYFNSWTRCTMLPVFEVKKRKCEVTTLKPKEDV
jgi:hypothetical protein